MPGKTIFANAAGDIHFGLAAPAGFSPSDKAAVEKALKGLKGKKLWRCNVCNDLSLSKAPPDICPTCATPDAYVEISEKEFRNLIGV